MAHESDHDAEWRPIDPDGEREVDLDDEPELDAPTTIDPEERVEVDADDPEAREGDGPREP
ncbi:MAG TPA: hypothetical protein VGC18_11630 [Lacisediminihabitans sp.]|uniref:hypothetical protein n=1 Tax=Lacisediminihabitans sp. TaxID=2787631 RepID=UPI002ED7A7AB